jgi:hypothetical protein
MVVSPKFEISITMVIMINMIILSLDYYNSPKSYSNALNIINTMFITIYGLESFFKIVALRMHFFRNEWNIFDLIINILSIICN